MRIRLLQFVRLIYVWASGPEECKVFSSPSPLLLMVKVWIMLLSPCLEDT